MLITMCWYLNWIALKESDKQCTSTEKYRKKSMFRWTCNEYIIHFRLKKISFFKSYSIDEWRMCLCFLSKLNLVAHCKYPKRPFCIMLCYVAIFGAIHQKKVRFSSLPFPASSQTTTVHGAHSLSSADTGLCVRNPYWAHRTVMDRNRRRFACGRR